MNERNWRLGLALVIASWSVACGGSATEATSSAGGAAAAGSATVHDETGGVSANDVAASGSGGAGGACPAAPTPVPSTGGVPSTIGCFEGNAQGWLQVPCEGDLNVSNPSSSVATVELDLDFQARNGPISATTAPSALLYVPDPDGTYTQIWQNQAENGTDFKLELTSGAVYVRVLTELVELDAVPLASCGSFFANAQVAGGDADVLTVHATVHDQAGDVLGTKDSTVGGIPPL